MDLDINNYTFDDLLKLFGLKRNFTQQELKQAYKIVYKAHPDKSGLDKEYFIFLSSAVKMLKQVYEILNKTEQCAYDKEYIIQDGDKKELVNQLHSKYSTPEKFRVWFNREFEEIMGKPEERIQNNSAGYDDWQDESYEEKYSGMSKEQLLTSARKDTRQILNNQGLVVYQEPKSLGEERVEGYSNKLPYEDVKRAYTETVVPVMEEEVTQNPLYHMNSNQLRQQREVQDCTPIAKQEAEAILREKREKEGEGQIYKAFEMVKEEQENKYKEQQFWNHIQQLTY